MPQDWFTILVFVTWASLSVGIVAANGWWRRDALPLRVPTVLDRQDLFIGIGLYFLMTVAAGVLIQMMTPVGPEDQALAEVVATGQTMRQAMTLLLAVLLTQGTVSLYVWLRMSGVLGFAALPNAGRQPDTRSGSGWPNVETFEAGQDAAGTANPPNRGLFGQFRPIYDPLVAMASLFLVFAPVTLLGILVQWVARTLGDDLPDVGHSILEQIQQTQAFAPVFVTTATVVLLVPVFEEIIFRGLIHQGLGDLLGQQHRRRVLIAAAGIFAIVHLPVLASPLLLLPLFALALVLGWLYERTGRLWPGIVLHAAFNALNVTLALLQSPGSQM